MRPVGCAQAHLAGCVSHGEFKHKIVVIPHLAKTNRQDSGAPGRILMIENSAHLVALMIENSSHLIALRRKIPRILSRCPPFLTIV